MKTRITQFCCLFLFSQVCLFADYFCGPAHADDFIPDIKSSASILCLNGQWQFRLDPNNVGEQQRWWKDSSRQDWGTIDVPFTYNMINKDMKWYQGKAWYSRTFKLKEQLKKNQRAILRFLGVSLRGKVWLNGHYLGEHLFPYTGFEFDATDHLNPEGDNYLVVQADNKILTRAIPDARWNGWWFYGGIYRDVYIELRTSVATTNLWLDTKMAGQGWDFEAVSVVTNYGKRTANASLTISLHNSKNQPIWMQTKDITVKPGDNEVRLNGSLMEIDAWSPDSPTLYEMTATINGGCPYSRTIKTGFRQIEAHGSQILLNGKPLLIKGTARHEEFTKYGSAVPHQRTRLDIEDVKELGSNFLRTAHYTQHPYFYQLCDELGLLVWTEIPAWKTSPNVLADPQIFETYAKPQLAEMVNQYRRYPSVVIWSIGNEFPSDTEKAAWYVEHACDFVRRMDPTRLVTFASDRHREDKPKEQDISFPYVDVISVNEYYGWYYGTIYDVGRMLDRLHKKFPDKPILVSEFGSGAAADVQSGAEFLDKGKNYWLDYQLKSLQIHMEQIFSPTRRKYVAGGLIWVYSDFEDPHRIHKGHPVQWNYVNLKGLVTLNRSRKPSFDLVKRFFKFLDEPPKPKKKSKK